MSREQILEWFYVNSLNLSATNIILVMLFGLGIGAVIYITYKYSYKGVAYNHIENFSNVFVLLITTVIMLMISSNIVISLGMVGALSIVRFRTAIKDPRDTMFLFWAIIEGLSIGALNYTLASISTFFIAIVILAYGFITTNNNNYTVVIKAKRSFLFSDLVEKNQVSIKSFQIKNESIYKDEKEIIANIVLKKNTNLENITNSYSNQDIISIDFLHANGESLA